MAHGERLTCAMPYAPFVPLRVLSSYTMLEGAIEAEDMAKLAGTRGFPAMAITDRNGLILASSVPAPSIWAIPEDVPRDAQSLRQLAHLLEMPLADLNRKLEDEDKTFVWLKRQVDESVAQKITALNLKGIDTVLALRKQAGSKTGEPGKYFDTSYYAKAMK